MLLLFTYSVFLMFFNTNETNGWIKPSVSTVVSCRSPSASWVQSENVLCQKERLALVTCLKLLMETLVLQCGAGGAHTPKSMCDGDVCSSTHPHRKLWKRLKTELLDQSVGLSKYGYLGL